MLIKKLMGISQLILSGYEPANFKIEIIDGLNIKIDCRYSQVSIAITKKIFYQTVKLSEGKIKKDDFSFLTMKYMIESLIDQAKEKEKKRHELKIKSIDQLKDTFLKAGFGE
jgi:hypothetical protein